LGFPHTARTLKYLCNELNQAIGTINSFFSDYKIPDYFTPDNVLAFDYAPNGPNHELLNRLHNHFEILQAAKEKLKQKIKIQPIGFNLLPEKFTLSQLHRLYESILEKPLDKRNFRRKIQNLDIISSLKEKQWGVAHKPSQLFIFNEERYQELTQNGFDNFDF